LLRLGDKKLSGVFVRFSCAASWSKDFGGSSKDKEPWETMETIDEVLN
jgi:hypothetical protein